MTRFFDTLSKKELPWLGQFFFASGREIGFSAVTKENVGGGLPDAPSDNHYEFAETQSEYVKWYRRDVEDTVRYIRSPYCYKRSLWLSPLLSKYHKGKKHFP